MLCMFLCVHDFSNPSGMVDFVPIGEYLPFISGKSCCISCKIIAFQIDII